MVHCLQLLSADYFGWASFDAEEVSLSHKQLQVLIHKLFDHLLPIFLVFYLFIEVEVKIVSLHSLIVVEFISLSKLYCTFFRSFSGDLTLDSRLTATTFPPYSASNKLKCFWIIVSFYSYFSLEKRMSAPKPLCSQNIGTLPLKLTWENKRLWHMNIY